MFNRDEVLNYFKALPQYDAYKTKTDDEVVSLLFDAYEDIHSVYPNIEISSRMIAKQMLYKAEAEQTGFGISQRHGLASRKINDASITFNGSYNMFDPYVWQMIEAQTGDEQTKGYFGRLV